MYLPVYDCVPFVSDGEPVPVLQREEAQVHLGRAGGRLLQVPGPGPQHLHAGAARLRPGPHRRGGAAPRPTLRSQRDPGPGARDPPPSCQGDSHPLLRLPAVQRQLLVCRRILDVRHRHCGKRVHVLCLQLLVQCCKQCFGSDPYVFRPHGFFPFLIKVLSGLR